MDTNGLGFSRLYADNRKHTLFQNVLVIMFYPFANFWNNFTVVILLKNISNNKYQANMSGEYGGSHGCPMQRCP